MDLQYLTIKCPDSIDFLVKSGHFNQARAAISRRLEMGCTPLLKSRLEHELLKMKLIENDYSYTEEALYEELSEYIEGLTLEEVRMFSFKDYMLWHMVDGVKRYHKRAPKTIIKENTEIAPRLTLKAYPPAQSYLNEYADLDAAIEKMRKMGEMTVSTTLSASLTLDEQAIEKTFEEKGLVDDGIRHIYLPIPRCEHFTEMKDIQVITKGDIQISKGDFPQRTVYAKTTKGDSLKATYTYVNRMVYRPLYEIAEKSMPSESAISYRAGEKISDAFLKENPPHIVFSPLLRELSKEIVGDETETLIKAKKIYDYVTQNIRYTFMNAYRTLINIPEFGALNLKGDCGVQALLFITLCRIAGVPASFASGLMATPGSGVGMHDWAAFHHPMYGWCFVDPSYGESAYRRGLETKWKFYFGNLDPYRMLSNFDFQAPFEVPKRYLRDDPYDNQVGEAETNEFGLYSEHYSDDVQLISIREE